MIRTLVGHEKPIISIKAVGKDVYSSSSDGQICVRPPSHALVPFHNAIQAGGILTENLRFCAYLFACSRVSALELVVPLHVLLPRARQGDALHGRRPVGALGLGALLGRERQMPAHVERPVRPD